ncbi:D-alanyl-D-alanine carboxypeptidase [Mycetocola sp. CAN_C7]|uniref:serine hydrolase domain-containing protein n=1 Tax=Mycetocola sp. CAN_C7 TaxID=2787724 RepID=UPI0018C9378E
MSNTRGRRIGVLATAVTVILGLSACAGTTAAPVSLPDQPTAEMASGSTEVLDAALAEAMALSASSGAIAGVWAPWSGSWVSAAGTTAPGGSEKMTTDMRFRIGDNTKPMTCDVLYALAEEGTVALDDEVSTYLPSIIGLDDITLEQLCHGTSGIGDYSATLGSSFAVNPTRQWSPVELISDGIARPRTGTPGEAYASSDTNYVLLGLALEEATTTEWDELYQRYVFDRLSMENSFFPEPTTLAISGPFAPGWAINKAADGTLACDAPSDLTELSNSQAFTAGGVVSTIDDMHTYAQSFATAALVPDEVGTEAWKTVPLSADAPAWQGFGPGGLQMGPLRGQMGSIPGHISAMFSDPTTGLTVVVMLNNSTAGAGFARLVAMKLAAIAAKAPPVDGEKLPAVGLPWSEEQMTEQLAAAAVCQPAA